MTTAAPSTALAAIKPAFTNSERVALAGFLARYRGLTHEAYALDLRQFTTWCRARSLHLFAVCRADTEGFATWKPKGAPTPPSPGGCAPSPGSTSTRSKKSFSSIPRPLMSGGRAWTTSLMPSRWTVTSSARCW